VGCSMPKATQSRQSLRYAPCAKLTSIDRSRRSKYLNLDLYFGGH
jgi:hypothetical protein